jgi:hypothetical protein
MNPRADESLHSDFAGVNPKQQAAGISEPRARSQELKAALTVNPAALLPSV